MQEGNLALKGPHSYKPNNAKIAEFRESIRRYGGPENIVEISYHRFPANPRPEILCPINVSEARRRNQDFVKCAICRPNHPKFAQGWLVWSAATGFVHPIGHNCYDKIFPPGEFKSILERYRGLQELDGSREFLVTYLPTWEQRIPSLLALSPLSECYRLLRSKLDREAAAFVQILRIAIRENDGWLRVETKVPKPTLITNESTREEFEYISTSLHLLDGKRFLAASYDPVSEYRDISKQIARLPRNVGTTDATQAAISTAERIGSLIDIAREIRALHKRISKLIVMLDEKERFLSPNNLNGMAQWSMDPRNRSGIALHYEPPYVTIRERHMGTTRLRLENDASELLRDAYRIWELN